MDNNVGQYNIEYKKCSCFWGTEPAKFVKLIPKYVRKPGRALDIGAGEGKNSFYLASIGYKVTAVEISPYAVRNFINRLIKKQIKFGSKILGNIEIVLGDILNWPVRGEFDVVVSYGLLHCLRSKKLVIDVTNKTKKVTKKHGLNVVCSFTKDLPIPKIQKYLNPTLLGGEEIKNLYRDWDILEYEIGTIEHIHPTSKTLHKHAVCRLIARRQK